MGDTMYRTIRIPEQLVKEIDQVVERSNLAYRTRAEFVNEAIRALLTKAKYVKNLKAPCPHCGQITHIISAQVGTKYLCGHCNKVIIVDFKQLLGSDKIE